MKPTISVKLVIGLVSAVVLMTAIILLSVVILRTRPRRRNSIDGRRSCQIGRRGADDQIGAMNLVTPAKRRQAASLVKEGFSVSLARDADSEKAIDNPAPYERQYAGDWVRPIRRVGSRGGAYAPRFAGPYQLRRRLL